MSESPPLNIRLAAWIPGLTVWGFCVAVAKLTTRSTYSVSDATAMALLYAFLTLALIAATRLLAGAGRRGVFAGALLIGLVLAWHLREQTRLEGVGATLWTFEGIGSFLLRALIIAAIFALLERIARGRRGDRAPASPRRSTVFWLASSMMFFLMLGATFFGSNTLRWHLLRHNKMLGTTAFHLFADRVSEIEAEAWASHGRGAPTGQPDWVVDLVAQAEADAAGSPADEPRDDPRAAAEGDDAERTLASEPAPGDTAPRPPDVVFVMLDTLRADSLEAYGGDPELMPYLNRFATESLLFTDVLANAPWTQPSVASSFTGLVPEEHGVISVRFRLSSTSLTLAEVLKSQGYETAAFVANGVIVNPDAGFVRGFDSFEYLVDRPRRYARADIVTNTVEAWLSEASGTASRTAQPAAGQMDEPAAGQEIGPAGQTDQPTAGQPDEPTADARQARPPLFLYIHYFDPHVPYLSSGNFDASRTPIRNDDARAAYEDELRFLDAELQRLIEILDRELSGPRVTFVTSDHGEEFGEHDGRGHSQTLYSEVLDVPAIAHLRTGTEPAPTGSIDAPLEGRDFFELLVRAAVDPAIDARSWATATTRETRQASLWFEKDPGRSETLHYLLRPYRHRIYSRLIQRDNWRLIWSAYGRTGELYDLSRDPGEHLNVAARNPDVVRSLRVDMEANPRYWVGLQPMDLSESALEKLRALGYIR